MDESEYEYQLALVSNSRISSEDFTKVQREAKDIFLDIEGALRPWLGKTKEDRQAGDARGFKEQWEALAGFNPDDKEALDRWSEELAKHTNAAVQKRTATEHAEADRQASFQAKLAAVSEKRFRQQGRK
jgi:hypothetical protein